MKKTNKDFVFFIFKNLPFKSIIMHLCIYRNPLKTDSIKRITNTREL